MTAEQKLSRVETLLRRAEAKLLAFRNAHPGWKPPEGQLLLPKDDEMARDLFAKVDNEIDIERQMELDPSGNSCVRVRVPLKCLLLTNNVMFVLCNRGFDNVLARTKTHATQQEGCYLESTVCP